MKFPGIVIGDELSFERLVDDTYVAGNFWKTDVDALLSTPGVVAIMIEACTGLVDPKLPEGFITVGKRSDVIHEHPTVQGTSIKIRVEIVSFDGYHIKFRMTLFDPRGVAARGYHERSIVNKRWMQIKMNKRLAEVDR